MILPCPAPKGSPSMVSGLASAPNRMDGSVCERTLSMISCAFQILISPEATKRSTTVSNSSGGVPAAVATERAWSVMCPCWMPSVTRALSAENVWAKPTAPMTSANSRALWVFINRRLRATVGLVCKGPPTVPTLIGTSSCPIKSPLSALDHSVSAM